MTIDRAYYEARIAANERLAAQSSTETVRAMHLEYVGFYRSVLAGLLS